MPEGARPVIQERDFTIASIAASSAVREEAAAAAATAAVAPTEETDHAGRRNCASAVARASCA